MTSLSGENSKGHLHLSLYIRRPLVAAAAILSLGITTAYYLQVSSFLEFVFYLFIFSILDIIIIIFIYYNEERNGFNNGKELRYGKGIKYRRGFKYSKGLRNGSGFWRSFLKINLMLFLIFAAGFSLMSWQELKYRSPDSTASYNGYSNIMVTGQVREDLSDLKGNKIYLIPYYIGKRPVQYGQIQLDKRYLPEKLIQGDIVALKLSLYQPKKQMNPGGFSSFDYLKREGIYTQGYYEGSFSKTGHINNIFIDSIIDLKYRLIGILEHNCPAPYNELYKAFLLGERSGLPEEWDQYFTMSGVNHLLAISGLHVGFIVAIFLGLLKLLKLPVGLRNLLLSLLIIFYIIMTGLRASVFRAGLLALSFLWAPFFGRRGDVPNILGLTAILNFLLNPYQLFSIGFQFSYFILLMIIFWQKILEPYLGEIFSVSAAALLGASPITAYYFNLITPVAVIANVWAIPLTGILVSVSLIALILGLFCPIISSFIFRLLIYPEKLLISGTRLMSMVPLGNIELATPGVTIIVYTVLMLFFLPYLLKQRIMPYNEKIRIKRLYYLGIIGILFVFINIINPLLDKSLEICFISVGQGDSIFIRSPGRHYFLVDGGGFLGDDSTQGEYTILPYLIDRGVRYLDLVFVTHFDADHAAGLIDIIRERSIGLLVLPYNYEENEIAHRMIYEAEKRKVKIILVKEGDYFEIDGIVLNILNPPDRGRPLSRNENSLVISLKYHKFSLLLTGDLEVEGEKRLIRKGFSLQSDILKLGHHGSKGSSSDEFLRMVSPVHGIISVGKNNYGHPAEEILERAVKHRINIWRTDQSGAVTIRSDGYSYSINGHLKR